MTTHTSKDVMIAYANDCTLTIQRQLRVSGNWVDIDNPVFTPDVGYRVKPEKHPDIIAAELAVEQARWVLYDVQDALEDAKYAFEDAKYAFDKAKYVLAGFS